MDLKNVFSNEHIAKMKEPIIQKFLQDETHRHLLKKYVKNPTSHHRENLDKAFKDYYKKVKIVTYLNKLIYFFSIDYDKKVSNYTNRYHLSLDAPLFQDENSSTPKDNLVDKRIKPNDLPSTHSLSERLVNYGLYYAWYNELTPKQRTILSLIYEFNYSNKDVADFLNESKQTVSYNHKKALGELRSAFDKEDFYV
ncbi:RNA polymerase sigma-B factor [Salimicrobium jeotgali]|uniref:RNA polymerase sigma-B factor n=1 Tax=Salimicrobium jeotgali TaxID=1230341 RepID=K2GK57_9BACI|nr:sigma-70 family RNA polymerase sigma factor [Salimicrobium jeotgali]EKE30819.1 RNA polymerase sigma-B factor [Salimicrobium jeotgali]MBM7697684.1 RNA polymerase sigma factor (sigma-70 family) [Salimicrobium jeotgali]